MIRKFPISLPWILALLVVGWIIADNRARGDVDPDAATVATDLVCNMDVATATSRRSTVEGVSYFFCSEPCQKKFESDPKVWVKERCLVCGVDGVVANVGLDDPAAEHEGRTYHFCTEEHRQRFAADPAEFFMHQMLGIPDWMFQVGVGFLLLVSFGLFELIAWKREKRAAEAGPDELARGLDERWVLTRSKTFAKIIRWRWTRRIAQAVFAILFVTILAAGLFGHQNPGRNVAPVITWTVWWGGLVVAILFIGKAWCYVCPWDAIARWADRLLGGGERASLEMKWPRIARNIWPATFLFVGLTWLDIGLGVTTIPRATAWMGLAMLALALTSTLFFSRQAFCRYGCLVGRVSGLYALFSGIEVRPRDQEVCASCRTMDCYRGNEKGEGCPTFEFPRMMEANTYCIMCTECVKTCPHENMDINIRPWGVDLVKDRKPRVDEVYLCLLMLSITVLHGLTMTPRWGEWLAWLESWTHFSQVPLITLATSSVMLLPIFLYAALSHVSARIAPKYGTRKLFLEYAYSLLPIALFYHLAHNSEHLLMEGPKVVAFLSDPIGRGWNLFGTADWVMPPLVTLEGLWGVQVLLVLVGHLYALWIADRVTRRLFERGKLAFTSQVPMLVAMIAFSVLSLWLLKQPMEMRVSAM